MQVLVTSVRGLLFDNGDPVRAASGIAPWRGGVLVVQDDATHAAHLLGDRVTRVRVLPPVDGLEVFSEAEGTKARKPDLEAACVVPGGDVLLLGSGSAPARTRAVLMPAGGGEPRVTDLAEVHADVRSALGLDALNLEGACVLGGALRWWHRGAAGAASGSVGLDLAALLRCFDRPGPVPVASPRSYDLGPGGLAVTDALALPDGRVLVSVAAEDAPDAVRDGPVGASGLALLDGDRVVDTVALPLVDGAVVKVEGLCPAPGAGGLHLLAVVDADDPARPSLALALTVSLA